jgi:hypothetical protein
MTIWKITLLIAVALLAPAQVPVKTVIVNPTKLLPPRLDLPRSIFEYPTWPPRYPKKEPWPIALQERYLPPSEYDHAYDGELTVLRTLESVVFRACAVRLKPDQHPLGCSRITSSLPRKCTVWIVTDEELKDGGWNYDIVLRHETGHCNGWVHK